MTQPPPDDQRQWQQPAWDQHSRPQADPTEADPPKAEEFSFANPDSPVFAGAVIAPRPTVRPASVVESSLRVLAGLVWPIAITFWVLGYGGWLVFLAAVLTSTLFTRVARELKRRREGY